MQQQQQEQELPTIYEADGCATTKTSGQPVTEGEKQTDILFIHPSYYI